MSFKAFISHLQQFTLTFFQVSYPDVLNILLICKADEQENELGSKIVKEVCGHLVIVLRN